MTIDDRGISGPLRVVRVLSNGKRRYDSASKARLIEACLDTDVSIAGLALVHGINTNQLRKWVKLHQDRKAIRQALTVMPSPAPTAFVPVVAASPIAQPSGSPSQPSSPRVRLKASLPNGVRLELEDADEQVLSVMIEALGGVMFRLADDLRVYLHRDPIDFRSGINSLAILVEQGSVAVMTFSNPAVDQLCGVATEGVLRSFRPLPT